MHAGLSAARKIFFSASTFIPMSAMKTQCITIKPKPVVKSKRMIHSNIIKLII